MTEIQTQFLDGMLVSITNGLVPDKETFNNAEEWDGPDAAYDETYAKGQAAWDANHPGEMNPATGIIGAFIPDETPDDDETSATTPVEGLTARRPHPCGGFYDADITDDQPGDDL